MEICSVVVAVLGLNSQRDRQAGTNGEAIRCIKTGHERSVPYLLKGKVLPVQNMKVHGREGIAPLIPNLGIR
jgi:hypothetical protein